MNAFSATGSHGSYKIKSTIKWAVSGSVQRINLAVHQLDMCILNVSHCILSMLSTHTLRCCEYHCITVKAEAIYYYAR